MKMLTSSFQSKPDAESKYMFKVNNRNNRKNFEICSKLTIKTLERRQCFEIFLKINYFFRLRK